MQLSDPENYRKMPTRRLRFMLGVGKAGLAEWDQCDAEYPAMKAAVEAMEAELQRREALE